jgi:hypothetical protein
LPTAADRSPSIDPPTAEEHSAVTTVPTAKFFVNQGVVTSRIDMQNLLRPLLKQTVSYRFQRGRELIAHGTGWVERIVVDDPDMSTYFTPISISLNVDSFEHLEFDTRPDQLLVYTLVQGDERVIIEYAPLSTEPDATHRAEQLTFDTSGFVQMELQGLGSVVGDTAHGPVGDPVMDDPEPARRMTEPDVEA